MVCLCKLNALTHKQRNKGMQFHLRRGERLSTRIKGENKGGKWSLLSLLSSERRHNRRVSIDLQFAQFEVAN